MIYNRHKIKVRLLCNLKLTMVRLLQTNKSLYYVTVIATFFLLLTWKCIKSLYKFPLAMCKHTAWVQAIVGASSDEKYRQIKKNATVTETKFIFMLLSKNKECSAFFEKSSFKIISSRAQPVCL